jgi:hypothetical protein
MLFLAIIAVTQVSAYDDHVNKYHDYNPKFSTPNSTLYGYTQIYIRAGSAQDMTVFVLMPERNITFNAEYLPDHQVFIGKDDLRDLNRDPIVSPFYSQYPLIPTIDVRQDGTSALIQIPAGKYIFYLKDGNGNQPEYREVYIGGGATEYITFLGAAISNHEDVIITPEPTPSPEPTPIVCEDGQTLVDGRCVIPTPVPTISPTPVPTITIGPTIIPTPVPTTIPTPIPTVIPTPVPTTVPTTEPTPVPTPVPTTIPTTVPTAIPTTAPTVTPTATPTAVPTTTPTTAPTTVPTTHPTTPPTTVPTTRPTASPTPTPKPVVCKNVITTWRFDNDNDEIFLSFNNPNPTSKSVTVTITEKYSVDNCITIHGYKECVRLYYTRTLTKSFTVSPGKSTSDWTFGSIHGYDWPFNGERNHASFAVSETSGCS